MSVANARPYVARGAAFLDGRYPNWAERIHGHREELNLGSCVRCVLGILFGDFKHAVDAEELARFGPEDTSGPAWMGFDLPPVSSGQRDHFDYSDLHEAWLEEVDRRLPVAAPEETPELVLV